MKGKIWLLSMLKHSLEADLSFNVRRMFNSTVGDIDTRLGLRLMNKMIDMFIYSVFQRQNAIVCLSLTSELQGSRWHMI
jgi:hypothetical protein